MKHFALTLGSLAFMACTLLAKGPPEKIVKSQSDLPRFRIRAGRPSGTSVL
jgi:hypothetical protein